jgi:hypothetical protein
MGRISESVTKRLYALSSNRCAFPKCPTPLVDPPSGKVTGRICHIRARSAEGPRYDPSQTAEDRDGFDNLLLLCPVHHDVIDADVVSYTTERLVQMKLEHEENAQATEPLATPLAEALVSLSDVHVQAGSVLVAGNPTGGQIAHNILNIQSSATSREAVLEPVVMHWPHDRRSEFSTLEIRLRNVGNAKPNDARVTLKFPETMNRHNTQDGFKAKRDGLVICERDNRFFQDQNLFQQMHPGDVTEQTVLAVHYFLERETALKSTEQFEIQVRTGDHAAFVSRMTFGQLEALPPKTWNALGPAGDGRFSEVSSI